MKDKIAFHIKRVARSIWFLALFMAFIPMQVRAQMFGGSDTPWEGPLETIKDSMSGSVLPAVMIIATMIIGVLWAMGETGGAFKRVAGWLLGAAVAGSAATILSSWFSIR